MTAQNSSAPSVLDEIKSLLVTKYEDPFDLDLDCCVGISYQKSNPRPCRNHRGEAKRNNAEYHKLYFSQLKEYQQDDHEFCERVKTFLEAIHCHEHIGQVMKNFEDWKQGRFAKTSTEPETISSSDCNVLISNISSNDAAPRNSNYLAAENEQAKEPGEEAEEYEELSVLTTSSTKTSTFSSPEDSTLHSEVTSPGSTLHELGEASLVTPRQEDEEDEEDEENQEDEVDVSVLDPKLEGVLEELTNSAPPEMREEVIEKSNLMRRRSRIIHHIDKKFSPKDGIEGIVYVLLHDNGNVKVGWTKKQTVDERLQHPNNCYAFGTVPYYRSSKPFVGAYRVETLVKADLRDKRVVEKCDRCGRIHTEWFRADRDDVVKSVKNWTTFVCGSYADGALNEAGRETMDRICPASSTAIVKAYQEVSGHGSVLEIMEALSHPVTLHPEDIQNQDAESSVEEPIDSPPAESEPNADAKSKTRFAKVASKSTVTYKKFRTRLSDGLQKLAEKIRPAEIPEAGRAAMERIFDINYKPPASPESRQEK